MNDGPYPDSDRVLADLGDRFVTAFVEAVDGARDDYTALKQWQPSWVPSFTARFTANFLHERIWDRLVRATADFEEIEIHDREPVRELRSGATYLLRIKRHHPGDRISADPTEASSAFWSSASVTLPGLETFSLALGYYWDADLRALGDAVLSFRDGADNPIWAVRLQRDAGSATGFTWQPVAPDLPELDLSGVVREADEETGS
ncbi:hypothetical protein [Rathayibacter sp. VKM Ac-2927]|uniref:hypothetical protein n=1 Tax=Rathayibacter sp. VKM Ac-2927 TaxID=2929478 RepID=UPI001FB331FA|nr:hypothetical protein [Rathayibacter sp. VKM Ac-2927]MCJ1687167.1 hypothetical protein [Rathayibacter sp. VKM Ac-2927]